MTQNKKSTRYYSKKQEKAVAKSLGGKVVPNSGATSFSKGDVKLDNWLIEAKTKVSPSESINIKREWITKNEEEAFAMGKEHSALVFNFGDIQNETNYYVITERDFKRLIQAYEEDDSDDRK